MSTKTPNMNIGDSRFRKHLLFTLLCI